MNATNLDHKPDFSLDFLKEITFSKAVSMSLIASSVIWIYQLPSPTERLDQALKMMPLVGGVTLLEKEKFDKEREKVREVKRKNQTDSSMSEIFLKRRLYEMWKKITSLGASPSLFEMTDIKDYSSQVTEIFPSQSKEKLAYFDDRLKSYIKKIETLQDLAKYLEYEGTQVRLQSLAVKAKDHVMEDSNKLRIASAGLWFPKNQNDFYEDIYRHLRVWLKVSIEYEVILPPRERKIRDRELYVEAFTFLRDHHLNAFLDPKFKFNSGYPELFEILEQHLSYLIDVIEEDTI